MSQQAKLEIRVGLGSCGVASGGEAVRAAIETAAREAGAEGVVKTSGVTDSATGSRWSRSSTAREPGSTAT